MGGSSMSNEGRLTAERARALALEAGFQEAGLVALPYESEARDAARFREWVAAGRAGTMGYLERRSEDGQLLRERAGIPFPWARSALICFASYAFPSAPLSTKGSEPRSGWIARYAWTSRVLPSRLLPSGGDAKGERRPATITKCCSSECARSRRDCTSSLVNSNRAHTSTRDRLSSARSRPRLDLAGRGRIPA